MTHPLAPLAGELAAQSVRYVLIGVSGANLYAPSGQAVFVTKAIDLYLPPDPENLVRAWNACERAGLDVWLGDEPLERPRDRWLAERVIPRGALVRATDAKDFEVDLTLVMAGSISRPFGTSDANSGSKALRCPRRACFTSSNRSAPQGGPRITFSLRRTRMRSSSF